MAIKYSLGIQLESSQQRKSLEASVVTMANSLHHLLVFKVKSISNRHRMNYTTLDSTSFYSALTFQAAILLNLNQGFKHFKSSIVEVEVSTAIIFKQASTTGTVFSEKLSARCYHVGKLLIKIWCEETFR